MATSTLGSGTLVLAGTTSGTTTVTATAVAGTTTLTLPAATDTLVGKATTDTLTNKTLTGAVMNGTLGATTPSTVAATTISASSTATFAAGAVGTPSITTSGDTNTGIFFPAADTIAFAEGGVEAARFDSAGNFGVGTISPYTKLDVTQATGGFGGWKYALGANATDFPAIRFLATTGNTGNIIAHEAGSLVFLNGTTATTAGAEKMRLDSSGNLLVGTTAQISGTTSRVNILNVNEGLSGLTIGNAGGSGNTNCILFVNSNGIVGTIRTNASATAYNTSSDYRLKENVAPMAGALAKVLELNPVTYTWKTDGSAGEGFVAHELAEVCPHAVTGEKDAVDEEGNPQYQGIDTSFLVATLTAAIQEQQALITQLQADVAALKGA